MSAKQLGPVVIRFVVIAAVTVIVAGVAACGSSSTRARGSHSDHEFAAHHIAV